MIPVPDLLHPQPRLALDGPALAEMLEVAYLGGDSGASLERALSMPPAHGSSWDPAFFREELFLDDLVEDCLTVSVNGQTLPVNRAYLREVLSRPPCDLETIEFRQAIVRELEGDSDLHEKTHGLYGELFRLLSLFVASPKRAHLDPTVFRLEILEQAKNIVDLMAADYGNARSGLVRVHESAVEIRASQEYRVLTDLLDFENNLAKLTFRIRVGADGKVRQLVLEDLAENVRNPFYQGPWRRLRDRLELMRRGYEFSRKELVTRVVNQVFLQIRDWLKPLLQLLGQLSFYLTALSFRARSQDQGLEMSLASIEPGGSLTLRGLFNPLLSRQGTPIPCVVEGNSPRSIFIITGPNSGGKTRLLQAVGLAQLLGQSGLYVPAAEARLPLVDGLFATTTERASVDQTEGRLGTELIRIRTLFESVGSRSLVMMDELCSGTNPSEAEEIFLMVLRLLEKLRPVGLITTHFLDFGRRLESEPPVRDLEFLQVEMDGGQRSTYQFVPGVASTSLAATTARRLGVTLDELSSLIERRVPKP